MENMGDKSIKKDWIEAPALQRIDDMGGEPMDAGQIGNIPGVGGDPVELFCSKNDQMDYYPFSPEMDTIGEVVHFLIFDTGTTYKLYKRYQTYGSRALVEVKDDRLPCDTLEVVMDVILDHGGNEFHVFIRHR